MTLAEHLDELRVAHRSRSSLALFVAMVVVVRRVAARSGTSSGGRTSRPRELQGIEDAAAACPSDPGEGFLSVLKLCFLVGAVVAAPVVLWQLWGFIAAGLYQHERRIVRIFFPVSLGLFALGVVIAYMILIPFGLRFLIGWNVDMGRRDGLPDPDLHLHLPDDGLRHGGALRAAARDALPAGDRTSSAEDLQEGLAGRRAPRVRRRHVPDGPESRDADPDGACPSSGSTSSASGAAASSARIARRFAGTTRGPSCSAPC